ncbi:MAG: hypothetical protein HC831_09950 [Chloroflexia bacterium]|nr:hypothetical protein [Chloroflexia bacterium]
MGEVIVVDTILVNDNRLDLKLKCYNKVKNSLAEKANLDSLNRKLLNSHNQSYSEILFGQLTFLMDLKNEQARIEINSTDAIVIITMKDGELKTFQMTKMGEIADGYRIEIKSLKGFNKKGNTTVTETLDVVKKQLIAGLRKEYKKYEATFENYEFDVVSQIDNELIIDINNVVKLVISDVSYFEHINLKFQFKQTEKELNVDYVIRAKYGSGIIWAPRSSDYYDMTPEYQEELERFSIKIKNQINNILKTNNMTFENTEKR